MKIKLILKKIFVRIKNLYTYLFEMKIGRQMTE